MAPPTRRQNSKNGSNDEAPSKSKRKSSTTAHQKDKNEWVCIINDEVLATYGMDQKKPTVCKIRHPRTKLGSLFLLPADESKIFQLFEFKEKYRSWFVGDKVYSDGDLYLTSPMDPLFLILPYLMETNEGKQFMTLDQLICDTDFPDCAKLVNACSSEQVKLICDCKEIDEETSVYRYNKEKTLSWLKVKTESLADALETKKVQVNSKGSHSSMFVRSKSAATSRESYIEYAYGMVSDFLSVALDGELKSHMGITDKKASQDSQAENEPPSKKAKLSGDLTPIDDYSLQVDNKKSKKNTKLTAAQKQLSKVDKSGMKSISSFFSPKS